MNEIIIGKFKIVIMSNESWPNILIYSMNYDNFIFDKIENCVYQEKVEVIKAMIFTCKSSEVGEYQSSRIYIQAGCISYTHSYCDFP